MTAARQPKRTCSALTYSCVKTPAFSRARVAVAKTVRMRPPPLLIADRLDESTTCHDASALIGARELALVLTADAQIPTGGYQITVGVRGKTDAAGTACNLQRQIHHG
jgi:hypothetical protein